MGQETKSNAQPKLRPITVAPQKLLLWPNNPRLWARPGETFAEADFIDPGVQQKTRDGMNQKAFQIPELKASLRRNGYVPVDYIFVRAYGSGGHYLVLEGNRRVTAITQVLEEEDLPEQIRASMESLECMEITNDLADDELERMISRLLGMRHHGALKNWTPFARAAHGHSRYLSVSNQTDESFVWDEDVAEQVADGLSITKKNLREFLASYRSMSTLSSHPSISEVGGIEDKHYSLVSDSLVKGSPALREYLPIDPETLSPAPETVEKLDRLCSFSSGPDRPDAAIREPSDWRAFGKILADEDRQKRDQMLSRVTESAENPRDVYNDRERELRREDWSSWLEAVVQVVQGIELGGIEGSEEEIEVVRQLDEVLNALSGEGRD